MSTWHPRPPCPPRSLALSLARGLALSCAGCPAPAAALTPPLAPVPTTRLAYTCEAADPSPAIEQRLRKIVADLELANPDPETRSLFLDKPVAECALTCCPLPRCHFNSHFNGRFFLPQSPQNAPVFGEKMTESDNLIRNTQHPLPLSLLPQAARSKLWNFPDDSLYIFIAGGVRRR